jgi:hypothetical protein
MLLFDTLTLDAGAKVRFTNEGYMVAVPRVARSGIQLYSGREVGKPEMKVVRVFRPEDEVFNKDSMHSYAHKPLTNDHPRSSKKRAAVRPLLSATTIPQPTRRSKI